MIKNEFSARLAELLTMVDGNVRDLAQKSEIPYSTMRGYVAGDSIPNGIEQLYKIARANGVSMAWLLGDEDAQHSSSVEQRAERELKLLMTLAEHLSDVQRGIFIKQMLNSLLAQVEGIERVDSSDVKFLPLSVVELALKLDNLPSSKQKEIYSKYDLDE